MKFLKALKTEIVRSITADVKVKAWEAYVSMFSAYALGWIIGLLSK